MQNLEAAFETWQRGALVYLVDPDGSVWMIRPAAFVFATPDGFSWVEPSYADPYGASSSAWHERAGAVTQNGSGFIFTSPGSEVSVYPFDPDDPGTEDDAGPLEWFSAHIKENGLQWQGERERVRKLITPSIKAHSADAKPT